MEIGWGKLALIGKRGQTLDSLRRRKRVSGHGRGDGMLGEWLSGGVGNIKVIEATRKVRIQSYNRQVKKRLASMFSPTRSRMERTIRWGLVGEPPRSSYDSHLCGVN